MRRRGKRRTRTSAMALRRTCRQEVLRAGAGKRWMPSELAWFGTAIRYQS
jgi:hypothetical protein